MKKLSLVFVVALLTLMACEQHHCPTYNDAGPKHHHKPTSGHSHKG